MAEQTFETVAEWHIPNRMKLMTDRARSVPLSDLFTIVPLRCHWCKRERSASKVTISPQFHIVCLDQKKCGKFHKTRLKEKYGTPQAPESQKNGKKAADVPRGRKKGSTGQETANPGKSEEPICGEKHKIDGKTLKCRRKPEHKGKHKDRKENRW